MRSTNARFVKTRERETFEGITNINDDYTRFWIRNNDIFNR